MSIVPWAKVPKVKLKKDEVWKMKDGREIAVGDMTEEHAKNCLRLMLRGLKGKLAKQKAHEKFMNALDASWPPSGCDEYGSLE